MQVFEWRSAAEHATFYCDKTAGFGFSFFGYMPGLCKCRTRFEAVVMSCHAQITHKDCHVASDLGWTYVWVELHSMFSPQALIMHRSG